jgi:hypothetical protein
MRTRFVPAVVLCAALATALAPSPAAAAKKRKPAPCAPSHSTTLAASKDIRVYSVPKKGDYDQAYACLLSKNRRVLLANSEECMGTDEATGFRIAGRYVAWVKVSCGLSEGTSGVVVTDVAARRVKWSAPGATPGAPAPGVSPSVYGLGVNENGSAAWIGTYGTSGGVAPSPDDRKQVRKLEPGSPPEGTLVDSGPDINENSFGLAEDGFYYRKGTTPLFATLE